MPRSERQTVSRFPFQRLAEFSRDLGLGAVGFGFDHIEPVLRNVEEIAFRIAGARFREWTIRRTLLRRFEPEFLDAARDLTAVFDGKAKMIQTDRRRAIGG